MKVSVVMAYYNRKTLLLNTLDSISKTSYSDYEVIIVDDASKEEERLEDIVNSFKFPIKLIRINKEEKTHINSCIPYNKGFREVAGDVVIIQNPECYHVGDVIFNAKNIKSNEYYVHHCYSLPELETTQLTTTKRVDNIPIHYRPAHFEGDHAFYVHHQLNPRLFHFCSVITKDDLDDLGGFDERYAHGMSYDDNEFAYRIQKKGLNISFVSNPFVFHQWHYGSRKFILSERLKAEEANKRLFHEVTMNSPTWRVNVH